LVEEVLIFAIESQRAVRQESADFEDQKLREKHTIIKIDLNPFDEG
jgi:hypothetical protein